MKRIGLHLLIALLVVAVGFALGALLGRLAQTGAIRSMERRMDPVAITIRAAEAPG